ncbi:ubiquitin-like 1-activating enzyme E1 B [Monoraphidium neglectum]|uniref:Ubiquitin-like 1-activating enzyme E1 B n=1 Tax=Monoraphidium neglectum TaxID=145388 RepID=A0A0D2LZM8_9CHLO|nr:ubiquitin-like 1-activating enzyme E1 B [Monoraphidium neglectum]KIY96859.1 ubiquitin-like 1-activating enzyme E1 B [Monoraphidium neglectum]|eukprot:XP_013895879.1 ubiquitin-like 1-activating enzyme E1 B [Monoraphidium neglectum]
MVSDGEAFAFHVDLDTIETSNLNRQFLFRKHHVGKSKAEVAAQVVQSFAPAAKIVAHQANVKESRFGLDFVRSKDIVLNGLDNLDARRHVNRLCVAGGVPLVESGTAGHKGQVTVHLKGRTECYECTHRPAQQRSYPICTLRNTPDKPIHCIVWAKEMLFARLFGRPEDVTDLDEGTAANKEPAAAAAAAAAPSNGDVAHSHQQDQAAADAAVAAAAAAATAAQEAAAEARDAASFFLRREGEAAAAYARRVFGRVFASDIERVAGMAELWKLRRPPTPLNLDHLLPDAAAADERVLAAAAAAAGHGGGGGGVARALGLGDHEVWSDADAALVFLAAVVAFLEHRPEELGAAVFDKGAGCAVLWRWFAFRLGGATGSMRGRRAAEEVGGLVGGYLGSWWRR